MKKEKRNKDFLHKPIYPGGIKAIRQLIKENLRYPVLAKEQSIEGTVHVKYTINYQGKVIEAKLISGIGYGCDEEAIRLVKLLQFEVAKNRRRKVLFHKKLQIHFRLPKKPIEKSAPLPTISYQYTIKRASSEQKEKGDGYSYTISW